jgi:hypothetical protein
MRQARQSLHLSEENQLRGAMGRAHRILHVVNSFDPAGDVVRCVAELKKYSRHQHELIVRDTHELQDVYGYPEAALMRWNTEPDPPASKPEPPKELRGRARRKWIIAQRERRKRPAGPCLFDALAEWADALIFHFRGWEDGWPLSEGKPRAFRNVNIYWSPEKDLFWSDPGYNAQSLDGYRLVSSSHVGATDFLPAELFRWLPDLIPIHDPLYLPDYRPRPACVSYIKHGDDFDAADFGVGNGAGIGKQRLDKTAHPVVLWRRQREATVVIDNVCDGHYGLAGCEAFSQGWPFVVFNHEKTLAGLRDLAPVLPPVENCGPSVFQAIEAAKWLLAISENEMLDRRRAMRDWTETYYASERLIAKFWDPFTDELVG